MTIVPDPLTAVLMTIPFVITYFALSTILFRPLYAYLMERDHVVHQAREETHELDDRIEKQLAALDQKLRSAREEAGAVRAEARHRAHEAEAAIIAKARAEADAQVDTAIQQIAVEQQKASTTMQGTATTLSADITRQILGREVGA